MTSNAPFQPKVLGRCKCMVSVLSSGKLFISTHFLIFYNRVTVYKLKSCLLINGNDFDDFVGFSFI